MANAGIGHLANDWLANTVDPTPLFSLLIQVIFKFLHPALTYILSAALIGIYFYSLYSIVNSIKKNKTSTTQRLFFLTLLLAVHSALWRFVISRLMGPEWSYFLEDGFAGQRLLGPVFQPSIFGVFLLLSIVFFLKEHYFTSILLATTSAMIHPTYLLSVGCLILAYIISYFLNDPDEPLESRLRARGKGVLLLAVFSFVLISPILFYTIKNFAAMPQETTQAARQILVNYRIPHHSLISSWFGGTSLFKSALLVVGLLLARKSRLFPLIAIPAGVGLILTLLQLVTKSYFLALLFPWRVSTFLIPISTALILDKFSSLVFSLKQMEQPRVEKITTLLCAFCVLLLVLSGSIRLLLDFERKSNEPERGLFNFVNKNLEEDDIYLIPIKMQDFRLATGAPAYIDFKSIPYQDDDVLEWFRRIKLADQLYKKPNCKNIRKFLETESITHIIFSENMDVECENLQEVYRDDFYILYEAGTH